MNKKTICLVTNWYPTKDNPFLGLFFKEQAFAVSESFDFLVVHYNEHIKKKIGQKFSVNAINKENNTLEYSVDVYVPVTLYIANLVHDFKIKYIKRKNIEGIGKYVSERKKIYTQKMLIKAFEEHIKEKFDVLYCVDAQQEAFNLQCLSRYFNKPYIVAEHAPVPWPGSVISDINKYAIEEADLFLAISNDKIRQLLLQNIKLPEVTYIGNLIDETKFKIKERMNDVKTFIIVAAHSFYKNYDLFIAVMNRLTEVTNSDFKVMIVGYGANKGYSKDVNKFESQIKTSKFASKAIMIPSVPHEQIGSVLNQADAFVMTSIQEGQPVSAMEAACCGLPIFSTRCGGVEDYVDGKTGCIYDVLDYEGMAQGLKDFLEGKIYFDSQYIREHVVRKFGNEAFKSNFVRAFEQVIHNYSRG